MGEHLAPAGEAHTPLPISAYSSVLENARLAFAGECRLLGFHVSNTKGAAQFVLLFDISQLPASGAVPVAFWTVPASSQLDVSYSTSGRTCRQGVALANSSTSTTLTAGSADCWFDVQVV